jgi:hypothetical protein
VRRQLTGDGQVRPAAECRDRPIAPSQVSAGRIDAELSLRADCRRRDAAALIHGGLRPCYALAVVCSDGTWMGGEKATVADADKSATKISTRRNATRKTCTREPHYGKEKKSATRKRTRETATRSVHTRSRVTESVSRKRGPHSQMWPGPGGRTYRCVLRRYARGSRAPSECDVGRGYVRSSTDSASLSRQRPAAGQAEVSGQAFSSS